MTPVGLSSGFAIGSDTDSIGSPGDLEGDVDGSFASGDEEVFEVPAVEMVPPVRPSAALMRASFMGLDEWNLEELFSHRGSLMRSVPRFLWGSFRVATKLALEEIQHGVERGSELQQEREWKLFMLLPRMMFHRSPRGGHIPKAKLVARFDKFAAGEWRDLIVDSKKCAEEAATARRRRRRRGDQNQEERRALRALQFVQMGELSSGRQALEGAELAPGNETTLRELNKRPARPMDPIPELPLRVPVFNLDEQTFSKNVRSARRGAAGGPSGMTTDHLRPLLDNTKDTHLLFTVAELLARGRVPDSVRQFLRLGRM